MSRIFWNVISQEMRQVLMGFSKSEPGRCFYLAGGTALALQLGHRQSFDLDFFTQSEDVPSIRTQIEKALLPFHPALADSSFGNLVFLASGTRAGFYGYGYRMVSEPVQVDSARLAGLADIGLMKLDAIQGRASRKDFIDLYFICQRIPLQQLLDLAPQKYPAVRDFESQVTRRLSFFMRAEQEAEVPLLQFVPWNEVKLFFQEQVKTIARRWIE